MSDILPSYYAPSMSPSPSSSSAKLLIKTLYWKLNLVRDSCAEFAVIEGAGSLLERGTESSG